MPARPIRCLFSPLWFACLAPGLAVALGCGTAPPAAAPQPPQAKVGKQGSACDPKLSDEACRSAEGTQDRMICDSDTKKWQIGAICNFGETCVETETGDGDKKSTDCVGGAPDVAEPDVPVRVQDAGGDAIEDTVVIADAKAEVADGKGDSDTKGDTDAKPDVKPPFCGNAKCEIGETPASCSKDCKPVASCGNSLCEADKTEDVDTCAVDCGFADEFNQCVQSQCAEKFKTCNANTVCAAMMECAVDCGGTVPCVDLCSVGTTESAKASVFSLLACTWQNLCYPTKCGDGACQAPKENGFSCAADCKTGGTTCGDSKCELPEAHVTCPADCKLPPVTCGNGKCDSGESTANCLADCKGAACGNGLCESGEGPVNCPADCKTTGCGNGKCDSGETATSCPADCKTGCKDMCGKPSTESGKACYCDEFCAKQEPPDCCSDKATFCPGGSCTPNCTGKVCGSNGCGGQCTGAACTAGKTCDPKTGVCTGPFCGDTLCNGAETFTTCAGDCVGCKNHCQSSEKFKDSTGKDCFCDSQCEVTKDCCPDKKTFCP